MSIPNVTFKTTELDLMVSLFRGETLFLFVPDATVEGEHWTVEDLKAIRSVGGNFYEIDTERGTLKVRTG